MPRSTQEPTTNGHVADSPLAANRKPAHQPGPRKAKTQDEQKPITAQLPDGELYWAPTPGAEYSSGGFSSGCYLTPKRRSHD